VFPSKYRVHIFLTVIALVIIFYPMLSRKPDQQRIDASSVVATSFFELIDAGQYAQSWETCAAYLKKEVPKEEWVKKLSAVRSVAGKLLERKQNDYTYTKNTDEGIPNGEYMVYHFDSKFENKDHLTETVTVMLEADNVWRIAGYFIE
jgi:ABC-type molybdate transport system substrate-binding protein